MIQHPDDRPQRRLVRLRRCHLHPDPEQVRTSYDQDSLIRLAESWRSIGQQQPLIGWLDPDLPDGGARLIDGHRRYFCMPFVPADEADCLIVPRPVDRLEVIAIQASLGVTNEKISPFDLADAAVALMRGRNQTAQEVAATIGCSSSKLSKAMGIKDHLAEILRVDVEAGTIPFTSAAALARLKGNEAAQIELAGKIKAGVLKRDHVEAEVSRLLKRCQPAVRAIRIKDGPVTLTLPGNWTWEKFIEFLTAKLKGAKRGAELKLPLDTLPGL